MRGTCEPRPLPLPRAAAVCSLAERGAHAGTGLAKLHARRQQRRHERRVGDALRHKVARRGAPTVHQHRRIVPGAHCKCWADSDEVQRFSRAGPGPCAGCCCAGRPGTPTPAAPCPLPWPPWDPHPSAPGTSTSRGASRAACELCGLRSNTMRALSSKRAERTLPLCTSRTNSEYATCARRGGGPPSRRRTPNSCMPAPALSPAAPRRRLRARRPSDVTTSCGAAGRASCGALNDARRLPRCAPSDMKQPRRNISPMLARRRPAAGVHARCSHGGTRPAGTAAAAPVGQRARRSTLAP